MPRPSRFCPAGIPVHAIQRGNNRQTLFTSDKDFAAYSHWLEESADRLDVQVHGWVFMTNHVHLLLTPGADDGISRLFQRLGGLYVRYFNFAYSRTGTLFDGRFKSSLVQSDRYLLTCLRYIELNPVRAGMVTEPGDYHWSSCRAHAFGVPMRMWTPHPTYLALADRAEDRQRQYRALIGQRIDQDVIAEIRHCANSGLVLGSEKFRARIGELPVSESGARVDRIDPMGTE